MTVQQAYGDRRRNLASVRCLNCRVVSDAQVVNASNSERRLTDAAVDRRAVEGTPRRPDGRT